MSTPREDANESESMATTSVADVAAWMAFLAGRRLHETDLASIAAALAEEGPMAELSAIEARRTLRVLDRFDEVARAHAWLYLRTTIHRSEQATGITTRALAVLHRHDPVLLPIRDGLPLITKRCIDDWASLRTVVAGLATPEDELGSFEPFDSGALRAALLTPIPEDLGVIALRRRVGHAPIARASIAELLRDPADLQRIASSLAGLQPVTSDQLDRQIIRLWTVAELRRLDRTLRPVADATEETAETPASPRTVEYVKGVPWI